MCTVSIIIPVYNVEPYLRECIESVYAQTFRDFEAIAIDDGSTDGSPNILRKLQNTYKDLKVISQKNRGLGATRNRGLSLANGKYIYFLDSDDVIEPNLLEKCVAMMRQTTCDAVVFEADIFGDTEGKNPEQYLYANKCAEYNKVINGVDFFEKYHGTIGLLNTPLIFFRRTFLDANNMKFMENVFYEDVKFYYDYISKEPRMVFIDEILYHRRYRRNSIMTSHESNQKKYDIMKVYLAIWGIGADKKIRYIYQYDVLKGFALSLEIMVDKKLVRDPKMDHGLEDFYVAIYDTVKSLSFLSRCQYCCGRMYLAVAMGKELELVDMIYEDIDTICEDTGLYDDRYMVGVYGTGKITDVFLTCCRMVKGEYPTNVVYIDTSKKTGVEKYKDNNVWNYKDVVFADLKCVIISSEKYEDEIYHVMENTSPRTIIYRLTKEIDDICNMRKMGERYGR